MNTKTFYQAILFGVVAVLLGLLLSVLFNTMKPDMYKELQVLDKKYVMEATLFFVGVVLRLLLTTDMGNKYLLSQ